MNPRLLVSSFTSLGFLLLSCTAAGPPSSTPSLPTATAASKTVSSPVATPKAANDQPRYGGILTISHIGDPLSFDMQQEVSYLVSNVVQLGYNGITQFDSEKPEEVIGDLAKDWELSKDGLTYTFHLNQNVKFHDGSALTAEDVRFSFDRMINPPKGILAPRRVDLGAIDKIEAPDKDNARFVLKYPSAAFLEVISSGFMVVYSKAFVEKKGHMKNDLMGSGPYKLKDYSAGVSLEYTKNPDYFVKGRPYLDGIAFYIIKDAGTRLAAFRTGQVKLTGPGSSGLTPSSAEVVKRSLPQAVIYSYPSICNENYIMNVLEKPWTDIRIRKAVHLAIDRQTAIDVLGQGYGEIGSNIPGKWGLGRDELEKMPGYRQPKDADLAEAKKLLTEAGYPDGLTVKTLVRAEKTFEDLAVYMRDQVAKIGIKMDLDVKEPAVRTTLLNQGAFNSHPTMNCFAYADPENVGRLWLPPSGNDWGMNWARFVDAKITDLVDKQSRAIDPKDRAQVVRELDLLMIEMAVRPVVWWKDALLAFWPEVKGRGKVVGPHSFQRYQDIWLAK